MGFRPPANDNREPEPTGGGWWMIPAFWAVVLLVLAYGAVSAFAGETIAGRASVIDGDTIEIHGQRIRLWGIDAPESRQQCYRNGEPWRCGTRSANALDGFLRAQTVTCMQKDRDRYGRIVAVCETGGENIGAWLVRQGWALDYVHYSDGAYSAEQEQAEAERSGMWRGEFEAPWDWRQR